MPFTASVLATGAQVSPPWTGAGEVAAAIGPLCWAIGLVFFSRLRPRVHANALNLGKNTVGTLCFMVVLLVTTGIPWPVDMAFTPVALFFVSGLIGLAIGDSLLLRSMLAIGPQRATLVFCLSPVFTAVLATLPPLGEVPSALTWVGMLVSVVGIALAVRLPPQRAISPAVMRRGVRDAIGAALAQAVGMILARIAFQDPTATMAGGALIRLGAGTGALVVFALMTRKLGPWVRLATAGRNKVNLPAAAFVGTFLGIGFHQLSIQWSTHTGVAATLSALTPVYLIPLGVWFLGERLQARAVAATALAVAGIALIALA